MERLRIGTLARRAQVTVDTIRYYERRGLLPEPERTESGYRLYAPEDVRRLRFIRQAQALGFSLDEIAELLALRVDPTTTCADIRRRVRKKIAAIEEKIAQLETLRGALGHLAAACTNGAGPTEACPILNALESQDTIGTMPDA